MYHEGAFIQTTLRLDVFGVPNESCYSPSPSNLAIDEAQGRTMVLTLYGMICAVGVAGNLLVCIVLLRVPSLRSNTSDFLVHLSLVDLVVCVLVIPYKIVPQFIHSLPPNPTIWGQLRCRLYFGKFPFWTCAVTSVFSLVTVNLERFAAIVYPHRYKRIFGSRRNKLLVILLCWILAVTNQSFILFMYDEEGVVGCRFVGWSSAAFKALFGVFNITLSLVGPFVLMVSVQWKVISTLKRQVQNLTSQITLPPADRRKMWQLRTTQTLARTLLAFVLTFAVCWAPNQAVFLFYNLGAPICTSPQLYHLSVILAVGNSCINPILYGVTNRPFRKGIRTAFLGGGRSARIGHVPTVTPSAMTQA
ncbi:somatostatin receptor type 3-like [Patiria miniata]|uniref:G-protein coupled receptors family 1 profile domain-containing protein n=1 Tax=Patiria miniata TaxID=46514 RepID=A0A914AQS2_PATMI|nr:somatostatin receptor type 3-like [Patiria miniata]